ncbi:hypothetical protein TEA_001206 [Camellia sinensis var. sinensis]|uniref:Protein RIK n=1 Tax=Camellia sinensis var. sinensis TaxID=542762 RepID=A0A4V3WQ38_CAMSN|nr:hypothetical protein TEA_001206 [Camellia sinensis var. sinensis]
MHHPQESEESKDAQIADLHQKLKALSKSKIEEEINWNELLAEKDIAIRTLTSLNSKLQERHNTIQMKLRILEVQKEDDTKTIQALRYSISELENENAKLHEQVQELFVQLATQPYRTPTQVQPQVKKDPTSMIKNLKAKERKEKQHDLEFQYLKVAKVTRGSKQAAKQTEQTIKDKEVLDADAALIWTSELNLITFEDIENLIKQKEIANNQVYVENFLKACLEREAQSQPSFKLINSQNTNYDFEYVNNAPQQDSGRKVSDDEGDIDRMTEDNCSRVSSAESMAAAESSTTKQRRKRKWDQPAESLITAGVAVSGILPSSNIGSLAAINLPGASSASGALLANPLTTSPATILQVFQAPLIQPHATVVVQKINQQKIQDELIAREIVINDADSAVRYKLTKRQTQEEIQKCTGAVVITRGKYRPPNAAPDGEKPLYLHISAGAHGSLGFSFGGFWRGCIVGEEVEWGKEEENVASILETTVERIKSVDLAAAMVEEVLKQGSVNNVGTVTNHLSTCVYLGFEADPSLNIAARIRGPNDQYVNHIMNETGATVLLRGRGSGNSESAFGEEGKQPLHLYLSSNNPKSIESAKLLAENLLDTISIECCASRVSSSKVYGAVPPPHQLLNGVQSSGNEVEANNSSAASLTSVPVNSVAIPPISSATHPGITTTLLQGTLSQSIGLSCGHSQPNIVCHPKPSLTGGTSYSGYGGIYPQATPLQQVALALRQSPSLVNSTVAPATTAASTAANSSETLSYEEKRRLQKRKFQELPVASKGHANPHQGSKFQKAGEPTPDLGVRNISTMQAPKKLVQQSVNGMVLPPPRSMPPPPPPPKFNSPVLPSKVHEKSVLNKSKLESVPDTLIKLMEYGEEDDEPDEITEAPYKSNSNGSAAPKPFWAV